MGHIVNWRYWVLGIRLNLAGYEGCHVVERSITGLPKIASALTPSRWPMVPPHLS